MKGLGAIAFVVLLFAGAALVPSAWIEGLPLCMIREVTGWDCPGCGLSRAFLAMFHGHWRQVFQLNALAPVIALYLAVLAADRFYTARAGRRPLWYSAGGSRWISSLFGVLALGQWLYKSGLHLVKIL
ncbi:MAG: DUF2752 domain-containing protein [Deltaproteobacteria bacterium]|nr:DUF2752 domain-containing protein [Deltaproteobacteria bacterium]